MKIKIIDSFEDSNGHYLDASMMGETFEVVTKSDEGVWVLYEGFNTLVIEGEYEIVSESNLD
jgi:hypothetical protein